MSDFRFVCGNVVVGDESVPGYSFVTTTGGVMKLDQVGPSRPHIDVDGNIVADGARLLGVGAERIMVSGPSGEVRNASYQGVQLANAASLTTGVVDDRFLQGDYLFGNITVTGGMTSTTLVGNANATSVVSGTIDDSRISGGYALKNLTLTSNLVALNASGNISTLSITKGTIDDQRLDGTYGFSRLTSSGNVQSRFAFGNIDASRLVTGNVPTSRFVGPYTFDGATASQIDTSSLKLGLQTSSRVLGSNGTRVIATTATPTELGYVHGVTSSIQDQLSNIEGGLVVGNTINNLDASQILLGTLDDSRLVGGYGFQSLALTGNVSASSMDTDMNASRVVSGTLDPLRIEGDYTHLQNMTATDTLSCQNVLANMDASRVVSGTVDDSRVDGSISFERLDTSTLNASWASGNIDASRIVDGRISPGRIDLDRANQNIIGEGTLRLGSTSTPWTDVWVDGLESTDIHLDTELTRGDATMQLDLNKTDTNIYPLNSSVTIGTSTRPWSNIWSEFTTVDGDFQVNGNLLDGYGNLLAFDLENVPFDLMPRGDDVQKWIGTTERPWEIMANEIHTLDFFGNVVYSNMVPVPGGLSNLGTVGNRWGTIVASNVEGLVDGNGVGDIWATIERDVTLGTIEATDGIRLPSESQAFRFFEDESIGMSRVGNSVHLPSLSLEPHLVSATSATVPVGDRDLGNTDTKWRDVSLSNTVVTPFGNINAMTLSTVNTGNVNTGPLRVTNSVDTQTMHGNITASQLSSGLIPSQRFDGTSLSLSNVSLNGQLVATGGLLTGSIVPGANAQYDLGSSANRFRDLYVSGSSIRLGSSTVEEIDGNVVLSSNLIVTDGVSGGVFRAPLLISNVFITDSEGTVLDDTAVSSTDGGYIQLVGVGFAPGSIVQIDGTNATSTTYISSTLLRASVGGRSNGTYDVRVIRPDSTVATLPSSLTFSDAVTWITGPNLGNIFDNTAYTIQLQGTSDSPVMYSNVDPLPPQTTLDSATGNLTGNITSVTESTVYSFGVRATDQELQDAILTCLLYYIYVALTSVQLTDVSWAPITQTALDSNSSGYLVVSGQGLDAADDVLVGGTSATSFSKVGSTSLRVAAPEKPRGTYDVSVVYGGNQTSKTLANAVYYSDVPVWSTSSALGNVDKGVSFNFTLEASSDSNIILYANTTALPPQTTLNGTTGALTGNITTVSEDILYNIGIRATDEEFQYANRTFLLQLLAAFKITSIWSGAGYHSAAISRDGELYMWGNNVYGQLGLGHVTNVWLPTRVTGGSIAGKVVTWVALGNAHTLVLCSDNTVHSCGYGLYGQLGNGGTSDTSTFVEFTDSGALSGVTIVSLSAGSYHSLARSSTGLVYGWGLNSSYQLGLGDTTQRTTPVAITGGGLSGKNVISIDVGGNHSVALADDGTVYTWGYGLSGQIGNSGTSNQATPLNVSGYGALSGKTIVAISPGWSYNLALASDNSVMAWGQGDFGSIGDGGTTQRNTPVTITNSGALNGRTITKIFASAYTSYALASDGTVIGWGYNTYYQLLDGTQTNRPTPQIITPLTGLNITSIAGIFYHALALSSTNEVYGWAYNYFGSVGNGTTTNPISTLQTITDNFEPPVIASIWGGSSAFHSAAITAEGVLYMWGSNAYGQLALGNTTDQYLPRRVTGGSIAGKVVTYVALGGINTYVLCSDNTVHSCGYGGYGGIGNGGTSDTSTFVNITGALSGVTVVELAAGNSHCLARSSTGLVYGWGYNGNYEIGVGDTTQRTTPVAITGGGLSGKNVISIGAGANHSVALADDGTVYTWGYGVTGQIGNGGTSNQSTPLNVSGYGALSGKFITAISIGQSHCLALSSGNSVLAWGRGDTQGAIGDGGTTNRLTAVDITSSGALNGRTITKIFTGANFSIAQASDGSTVGWGQNTQYQLLDGSTTNRPTPQIITTLNGLNIAPGALNIIALSTSNDVYGWGYNNYGSVADGTTTTASTLKTITENF
jgi:alpha-tubulin suppressor-like RCC1 family protein